MRPTALLINPWIYDFAAFDLWAKPLGLLYLAAHLQRAGFDVHLVDCLDRLHPESGAVRRKPSWAAGTGQWARREVPKPRAYQDIPRRYAQYGLPESVFLRDVSRMPRPDLILVTSSMTYWYLGVMRAISLVRKTWPGVPIVLGGTYATLCGQHARNHSGADFVVSGPGEAEIRRWAAELADSVSGANSDWPGPWPALDLYPRLDFAPILTSRGCPLRCPYCASRLMFDGFVQRTAGDVLAEIEDRHLRLGLRDFAFFDDALLVNAPAHLAPILEGVLDRGWDVRFHVPNGLHIGSITPDLARLMHRAGFRTLRLGLESLDPSRQSALGDKVAPDRFVSAITALKAAGFDSKQIGVYILYGLPGQPLAEVIETARIVKSLGGRPYLAEFSPLPGTPFWNQAVQASPVDLEAEPLYQNNTFFPCRGSDFSWEAAWEIKRAALR